MSRSPSSALARATVFTATILRSYVDCPDGTRLLLDASSGNSVLRQGMLIGTPAEEFRQVLLTHRHADHISGLPFIQAQRFVVDPKGPPLHVYGTEETLEAVRQVCQATRLRGITVDRDGAKSSEGDPVMRWNAFEPGQRLELGPTTWACCFTVDHVSGAVGWRVESDGISVVFSGDTRYSTELVEAARGARLLIHEAMNTEADPVDPHDLGHSTAAAAGRAAALAGANELVLTHIDTPFHAYPQPLVDDARRHFKGLITVASDLYQLSVGPG